MNGRQQAAEPFKALVVGGDSLVGRALTAHLRRQAWAVAATTRRPGLATAARPFLDLAAPGPDWAGVLDQRFDVAYLVAAVARLAACAHDPQGSWLVNVTGTANLARRLVERGVRVIFLSTYQVFDGHRAFRRAEEPTAPVTVYGRQKAAAENAVLAADQTGDAVAVLRLTKVLNDATPLFNDWAATMAAGRPITPFSDMTLAPVHAGLVASCLERIGRDGGGGVYQLSATRDVSYADAADRLAARMGVSADLVRPASWRESGVLAEPPASNTTLDMRRIVDEFGVASPDPWTAIDCSLVSASLKQTRGSGSVFV